MFNIHEDYLRSGLFGIQDGLVSTTGVVVGISAGIDDKAIIILASFVAVAVEATSMAAGQYSSEKAVHQLSIKTGKHTDSLFLGAVIMFFGYLLGGFVPIIPTIFFSQPNARFIAIASALLGLFVLGYIKGKIVKEKPLRSAFELLIIGSVATTIGLAVGYFFKI